jgi:hypothetical protein
VTAEPKREAYRVVADLIARHLHDHDKDPEVLRELQRIETAMRTAAAVTPNPSRPAGDA